MKQIYTIGLCFAAVLLFSVAAVTSASATEVLFSSATGTFKAIGGEAKLDGASEVKCTSTTSNGTIESAHLGKLKVEFENCTTQLLGSHKCTGTKPLTKTEGNITFEGPFHLGTAKNELSETSHAAILVLITEPPASPIEFNCAGVGTVKVTGSVVGLLQTKAGGHLVPEEQLLHAVTAFLGSGSTQHDKEFLLSLTTPAEELMSGQELNSEIFGIKGKSSEIASGEITEATPAGVHLVAG